MGLRDLFDSDPRSKDDLRRELLQLTQRLSEAEAAFVGSRAALASSEDEKADLQRQLGDTQSNISRLRDELSQALDRLRLRPEDLDERKRLLDLEEGRIAALSRATADAERRVAAKGADVDRRTTELTRLETALVKKERAQRDKETELGGLAAEVSRREEVMGRREVAVSARENALLTQEASLRTRSGLLDRREQGVAQRERDVAAQEAARRRVEQDLADSKREAAALRRKHQEQVDEVRRLKEQLEAALDRATKASSLSRVRAREIRELREELDSAFLLRVSNTEALNWLAGLHADEVREALGETPVTLGRGPWDEGVFDEALESAGFVPQLLDEEANSFEVFVVGREGVDIDALAGAVQDRLDRGDPVRLYSQELWLLHLMSGRDPLALEEDVLIEVFAQSHDTLSAFVNEEWDWPSLGQTTEGFGGVAVLERGASPLHAFGYRAGRGTDAAARRAVLKDFLECRSLAPYFDEAQHDLDYRNSWARPGSSARLRRMVEHIRWLIGFQGASANKAEASENWKDDLAWIRKVLAPRVGLSQGLRDRS
jgi:hypothetical protein